MPSEKIKEEIKRICATYPAETFLEYTLMNFAEFVEVQAMIRFRNEMNEMIDASYVASDLLHG